MLKKISIWLLLPLYLFTATGFALNMHYCMGRLTSVRIDAPAKECVTGQQTKRLKCCRDLHLVVKVKDTHQNAPGQVLGKVFSFSLLPVSFQLSMAKSQLIVPVKPTYRGPPPFPDKPRYLKHQNFRI